MGATGTSPSVAPNACRGSGRAVTAWWTAFESFQSIVPFLLQSRKALGHTKGFDWTTPRDSASALSPAYLLLHFLLDSIRSCPGRARPSTVDHRSGSAKRNRARPIPAASLYCDQWIGNLHLERHGVARWSHHVSGWGTSGCSRER